MDKSLIQRVGEVEGEPRFGMLETIREFGLERLAASGELAATRQRHAEWCLALAERIAAAHQAGHEAIGQFARLDAEHDNMRAALAWLIETGQTAHRLRLTRALWGFWFVHGHLREGWASLEGAVEAARSDPALVEPRIDALYGAAWLAIALGEFDRARSLGEECLTLARRHGCNASIAQVLGPLGYIAHQEGDYERAISLHEEALRLKRMAGDAAGAAVSLDYLGHLHAALGAFDLASDLLHDALTTHRALGRVRHVALTQNHLGYVAYHQGELECAAVRFRQALALFRQLGDGRGVACTLDHLGWVARRQGDVGQARALHAESLSLRRDRGEPGAIAASLESIAALLAGAGGDAPATAVRLRAAAMRLRAESRHPSPPARQTELNDVLAHLRVTLGRSGFDAAWRAGQALLVEDAVVLAAAAISEPPEATPAATPSVAVERFGLTPRERQVLRLIAERRTDREIAETLFISPRTVGRHLTNIFAKLGVHSRRQVATLAREHGLA